jgi:hypothetical protein
VSLYHLQKFLYDLNRTVSIQRQMRTDAAVVLAAYDLTAEEHTAITTRDIGLIYVLGANGQLLMHYAAFLGLPWPEYIAAMRTGIASHGPVRAGIYAMTTGLDERVAKV